jgi:hypothetical protein
MPFGTVAGNLLVAAVPWAKRALDAEAQTVPGTDLRSANWQLLTVGAKYFLPLTFTVVAIGVGMILLT